MIDRAGKVARVMAAPSASDLQFMANAASGTVRMPSGRSIAGFGRGGVVYLMYRDGANGWFLERTKLPAIK